MVEEVEEAVQVADAEVEVEVEAEEEAGEWEAGPGLGAGRQAAYSETATSCLHGSGGSTCTFMRRKSGGSSTQLLKTCSETAPVQPPSTIQPSGA